MAVYIDASDCILTLPIPKVPVLLNSSTLTQALRRWAISFVLHTDKLRKYCSCSGYISAPRVASSLGWHLLAKSLKACYEWVWLESQEHKCFCMQFGT